jgi:hypothetical protein
MQHNNENTATFYVALLFLPATPLFIYHVKRG